MSKVQLVSWKKLCNSNKISITGNLQPLNQAHECWQQETIAANSINPSSLCKGQSSCRAETERRRTTFRGTHKTETGGSRPNPINCSVIMSHQECFQNLLRKLRKRSSPQIKMPCPPREAMQGNSVLMIHKTSVTPVPTSRIKKSSCSCSESENYSCSSIITTTNVAVAKLSVVK